MAFLIPDRTYTTENGIEVCEKILPVKLRPNRKLTTANHKPEYITIHNTDDINEAKGTNDAEQYARATFNGNMGGVTVHFYIDETGCWQILPLDEIGYHAADGYNGTGNCKSIAVEIIMSSTKDTAAENRGAKLAAWLLWKYNLPIDRMKTHHDWYKRKYCPAYILPHWATFRSKVEKYLAALKKPAEKKTIYRVQIGAFLDKKNAEEYAKKATKSGFPALVKYEDGYWRVQTGAYSVEANAKAEQERLKKAGFESVIKKVAV